MKFKEYNIEAILIVFASMTTIFALILSFVYPNLQVLILTILTILLPLIYQVGNIYSKESIRTKNNKDISEIEEVMEDMEENINYLEEENKMLKEAVE